LLTFPRSRRARAALALTLAGPLGAAFAAPAFAVPASSAGDSAEVHAIVTDGNVHVTSTKGLSKVTVVLCGGGTVVADNWNRAESGDVPVDGVVEAVFIHSGDNTTTDAEALLALLTGDVVHGDSTGVTAVYDEHACDEPGGDVVDNGGGGDNGDGGGEVIDNGGDGDNGDGGGEVIDNGGDDNGNDDDNGDGTDTDPVLVIHSDPAPTTNSDPAPTSSTPDPAAETVVLGTTLERATVDPVVPAVAVLGDTVAPAAELPRTGSDVQPLLALALSLIAGGSALRAVSCRRTRSASFPG